MSRQQRKTVDRRKLRRGAPGQPSVIPWQITNMGGDLLEIELIENLSTLVIRPPLQITIDGVPFTFGECTRDGPLLQWTSVEDVPSFGLVTVPLTCRTVQDSFGRLLDPGSFQVGGAPPPARLEWTLNRFDPNTVEVVIIGGASWMATPVSQWGVGFGFWVDDPALNLVSLNQIASGVIRFTYDAEILGGVSVIYQEFTSGCFDRAGNEPIDATFVIPAL